MHHDAYVTRAQAAVVTGVRPDTIGKWLTRGWYGPDGKRRTLRTRPGPGRTLLFRLGDLLEAERDTRQNPNSRRRSSPLVAA